MVSDQVRYTDSHEIRAFEYHREIILKKANREIMH